MKGPDEGEVKGGGRADARRRRFAASCPAVTLESAASPSALRRKIVLAMAEKEDLLCRGDGETIFIQKCILAIVQRYNSNISIHFID